MNEEPKRDPMLREALSELEGDASLRDADADRLRQAILWSAASPLARLRERHSRTWRDVLARWSSGLVPAAVAAALLLALLTPSALRTNQSVATTSTRDALSVVVSGEAADAEVVDAMTGSEADLILASTGGAYLP